MLVIVDFEINPANKKLAQTPAVAALVRMGSIHLFMNEPGSFKKTVHHRGRDFYKRMF
jgi:hypothetical protein